MNTSGQRAANNQGERREGARESISGGGDQGKHRYDCTAKSSIIEELRNVPRRRECCRFNDTISDCLGSVHARTELSGTKPVDYSRTDK